jgi:hypothetical protein
MSLIRVRRERKEGMGAPGRPPRLWKQVATLAIILLILYYLSRAF